MAIGRPHLKLCHVAHVLLYLFSAVQNLLILTCYYGYYQWCGINNAFLVVMGYLCFIVNAMASCVHTSYIYIYIYMEYPLPVENFYRLSFCCDLPSFIILNNNKMMRNNKIESLGFSNLPDDTILGFMRSRVLPPPPPKKKKSP